MNLTMAANPSFVPEGNPSTVTLTIANGGQAVPVTAILFLVDLTLIDAGSTAMTCGQRGWIMLPMQTHGTQGMFKAIGPGDGLLLAEGALTFFLPISSHASDGSIGGVAEVSGSTSGTPLNAVSISVTSETAFTSLSLNPAQVGPGVPSQLSWDTIGAESCILAWTPADAVVVKQNGNMSPPNSSQMTFPTCGQATLTPTETVHLTLTAIASDNIQRTEQISLWMPTLALRVGSNPPVKVLDPVTLLSIPYWSDNDPTDPTSIALAWSGDTTTVTQDNQLIANGGAITAPDGGLDVVISANTTLIFTASTPDKLQSIVTYPLNLGAMAPVTLYSGGWFDASLTVTATAEGRTWNLDSGRLPRGYSGTLYVPQDSTYIAATVWGWDAGWEAILGMSEPGPLSAAGLGFSTWGSLFGWGAGIDRQARPSNQTRPTNQEENTTS